MRTHLINILCYEHIPSSPMDFHKVDTTPLAFGGGCHPNAKWGCTPAVYFGAAGVHSRQNSFLRDNGVPALHQYTWLIGSRPTLFLSGNGALVLSTRHFAHWGAPGENLIPTSAVRQDITLYPRRLLV